MNGSSNARILRIAFAASLVIHTVIASVVHSTPVEAQPQEQSGKLTVVKLPTPSPTPPPPPHKEHHQKQQHGSPAVRPPVHPPKQTSPNNANTHVVQNPPSIEPTGAPNPGGGNASPGPASTESPASPSPTPKPACSAPDVPAKTIDAVSPQVPSDLANTQTTAKVRVDLDASGDVVGTSIYESTGYPELDRAALDAARRSRYAAEEKNCKSVPGSYLFTVDFVS